MATFGGILYLPRKLIKAYFPRNYKAKTRNGEKSFCQRELLKLAVQGLDPDAKNPGCLPLIAAH